MHGPNPGIKDGKKTKQCCLGSNRRNKHVAQTRPSVASLFKSVYFGSCNEKEDMTIDLD